MDPALWELLRAEAGVDGDRVIEAIIRLAQPGIEVPDVRVVSRFGTIATCRIRPRDVVAVRARHEVISLKAAHGLSPGFEPTATAMAQAFRQGSFRPTDIRRGPGLALTGNGVVVASVDWGVDVDSAAFRWPAGSATADGDREPGSTRFLSFWDQRDQASGPRPDPYGYGTVHDRKQIDRALQDPRPYERLGYHPAIADRGGQGTHGTHVLDIAAGNGQAGGPVGIAPMADLIFVHLADRNTGGLANFGDSVRLLEAVDFISRTAGSRPCVINISAGRTCGPRDGTTLVERAFDELLEATPGRFVVNSAGNYFGWRTHSCGAITPGEARSLTFVIDPADITLNEVEIWYDGADEFTVRIDPPGYSGGRAVRLGERSDLLIEGQAVGRVYHRKHDPNNGDNHIVAYIDPTGRAGNWTVTLEAQRVESGRFHAWIERDDTCRGCQARFTPGDSNPVTTIGTITTSRLPLIVGAYDGHDPARPVAPFSSSGPSRDLRPKPDLGAPGVDVLAARSASIIASHNSGLLVRKSGTSMATPHVTGAVALCLEAAGNRLSARQIRSLVLGSCDPVLDPDQRYRLGHGYLNIPRLLADLQRTLSPPVYAPSAKELTMDTDDTIVLLAAGPATAYREYLYRPRSRLARWIDDRFDVVARPGQRIDRALQPGDVLLEVPLGQPGPGRCAVLKGYAPELQVSPRSLSHGQLLLRPRRRVEMSQPLPVEPTPATITNEIGLRPTSGPIDDDVAIEHRFGEDTFADRAPARSSGTGTALSAPVPTRSRYHIPEGDEHLVAALDGDGEWAGPEVGEELPKSAALADALSKRDWKGALKQAIADGWRSENDLTNLIFFGQHEELEGRKLDPEKNRTDASLATEWTRLRDKDVREAIDRAAYNPIMGTAGDTVAEFYHEFRDKSGLEFKRRVEWAAKEVNINPGLLAACLLAETGSKRIYLSTGLVSSYFIGTDDFYEMRFTLSARVPAYRKIGWDTTQVPVVHPNDAKRPRNVSSINFDSGRDALLATAVYLKYGELYLREEAGKLKGDFDSLPAEIRLALTRMTMAAGRAGTRPYLEAALNGSDILDRTTGPAVVYHTVRNATIRSAQALFLSEWVFGIALQTQVVPTSAPRPEFEERFDGDEGGHTGGKLGQNLSSVVPPFPHPISLPRDMANQGFIDCLDQAWKPADITGLCGAVVDLSGDPALPPYAGHNDTEMLYIGSMAKLFAVYAAFELRKRVQIHAKQMISDGLSTAAPGWQGKVFTGLKSAWKPQLDAAFPHLPSLFPELAAIFELSPDGDANFLENNPPLTFDELNKIGEFNAPTGNFLDWMRLALGWSNNRAAGNFITLLSYPYINGVLRNAGFFDESSNTGLWVSGNFAHKDWLPDDGAGRLMSPRWQRTGHKVSNFTGTALQVARFMSLLAQGRLVDSAASAEMMRIIGVPFLKEGLSTATPPRGVASIVGKVGIGTWDGRWNDAAIVTVNPAIRYVIVVLGSPPRKPTLYKLEVAFHDCVVSRH